MNNNRGNNRRRGRGNNRQQGGQHVNRIDSRARGNAPQLLEKYRKLAHDAHLNGDRVSEEYYLQFADHYFRVIADARQRQEEQRARRDERWQEGGETYRDDSEEGGEFAGEGDYAPYGREGTRDVGRGEDPRERGDDQRERAEASSGSEREEDGFEARNAFEPASNPFTRDARSGRGPRTRDERRPRRDRDDREDGQSDGAREAAPQGLDPSSLPPSIGVSRVEHAPELPPQLPAAAEDEPAPKPRRGRPRKVKPAEDGEPVAASGTE